MKTEVEVKVLIEDASNLKKFLEAKAKFAYADRQIDEYYTPAHRDFIAVQPIAEWLRLRDSDGAYSINYKYWHYNADGISNHCDEHETKVENIDTMRDILTALSFQHLVTVDKQRSAWNYEDYEICLDTVKDLGDFVEIEYKGAATTINPDEVVEQMIAFLDDIGCGNIERAFKGYPYALLEMKNNICPSR